MIIERSDGVQLSQTLALIKIQACDKKQIKLH
jgi:hypothetical protein